MQPSYIQSWSFWGMGYILTGLRCRIVPMHTFLELYSCLHVFPIAAGLPRYTISNGIWAPMELRPKNLSAAGPTTPDSPDYGRVHGTVTRTPPLLKPSSGLFPKHRGRLHILEQQHWKLHSLGLNMHLVYFTWYQWHSMMLYVYTQHWIWTPMAERP